ncbi:MAG: hypothetical protein WD468_06655, partial [Pirellulales bacterium]
MTKNTASNASQLSRREIVVAGAGLSAASLASLAAVDKLFAEEVAEKQIGFKRITEPGQTILFQGDSITDAGRNRALAGKVNSVESLGNGYAWLAAAQFLVDSPNAGYKIFNRGISGNIVYQLAERWQADCLDI